MIEWPDWDCCFVISVRWIASCMAVFSKAFAKHAFSFTYVLFFFFFFFLHLVKDVEIHYVLCLVLFLLR